MKEFKAESKRLLDLMINSIYTNKEIFLRELISNCSDALDKRYYNSISGNGDDIEKNNLKIDITLDSKNRKFIIEDNGCGMTKEELETNLGTIAKSGSLAFKKLNEKKDDVDIIGQFGVGFYSCFMVSNDVSVVSRAVGKNEAYEWHSTGVDGYTIKPSKREEVGTTITLLIKEDTEEEKYSEFLNSLVIKNLVVKYSDYIRYPIVMDVEHERPKEGKTGEFETVMDKETLNSMLPLWKKKKSDIKQEEYDSFYMSKFSDFTKPQFVINTQAEGTFSYNSLLFIPSHLPFDFYTKEYEKGLQLYSNGVLIMDKCQELLPDYFSFVKGLVDSPDLSLNISRELLQHDRQLKTLAKSIEKKINSELKRILKDKRDEYVTFFENFGSQLKFGAYDNYGMNKDSLKDLLMFYSSKDKALTTLQEYVQRCKEDQKDIYYACGESIDKIDMLPQVQKVKEKEYEILYLTENIDEFVIKALSEYEGKKFVNVSENTLDLDTEEEKEALKKENEENKEMLNLMKESLNGEVEDVRFTHRLKDHPVCLTSEGNVSIEMEKVINSMPTDQNVKAQKVLEINSEHSIASKIKKLYQNDKEVLKEYAKILYAQARLIEGMSVENPTEISNLVCKLLSK
ncbi:chaperone protein HtpG [Clostridium sp. CAG:921]|nr:chaperone protein HtpG [Clostridium sp. CAG:921]